MYPVLNVSYLTPEYGSRLLCILQLEARDRLNYTDPIKFRVGHPRVALYHPPRSPLPSIRR